MLLGGAEIARQASATIVGGHTIDDPEPKYGMAVTGVVRPGEQMTNAAARPGDFLVLTKPLGTGIVATAIKQGKAAPDMIAAATESMSVPTVFPVVGGVQPSATMRSRRMTPRASARRARVDASGSPKASSTMASD